MQGFVKHYKLDRWREGGRASPAGAVLIILDKNSQGGHWERIRAQNLGFCCPCTALGCPCSVHGEQEALAPTKPISGWEFGSSEARQGAGTKIIKTFVLWCRTAQKGLSPLCRAVPGKPQKAQRTQVQGQPQPWQLLPLAQQQLASRMLFGDTFRATLGHQNQSSQVLGAPLIRRSKAGPPFLLPQP